MNNMENKIRAAETLCHQAMQVLTPPSLTHHLLTPLPITTSSPLPQGSSAGVRQWRVNPQAVERCVADVVKIAKELDSDESRYFQAVSASDHFV